MLKPLGTAGVRMAVLSAGVLGFVCCLSGCRAPHSGQPVSLSDGTARSSAVMPAAAVSAHRKEAAAPVDPRVAHIHAAREAQNFVGALKQCRVARTQGVPLPLILEQEADIYKATGYLDKERETLTAWSKAAPKDARPWVKRFYLDINMGWRKEAEQASAHALRLAPEDARSYVTRAILHYRSNEPALGLPDVMRARRLAPQNHAYLNLHATILIKAGQAEAAETVARELAARAPEEPKHRLLLAMALVRGGKVAEGEALLRALQAEMPNSAEAAYETGLLAEKRGDLAEAERQFERAASLDSGYGNVLFCLGRIYVKQGRAEEGRALQKQFKTMDAHASDFETALNRLRSRPDDPKLHHQLAKIYLADKELPQAILELRRVLELRPHDKQAQRDLITALKQHGRLTEAQRLTVASSQQ